MKFRKRPVVVDAEQFRPEVDAPWPDGVVGSRISSTGYIMRTLENEVLGQFVTPGDWIITGVQGERYPCKDDIFRVTYEPVD